MQYRPGGWAGRLCLAVRAGPASGLRLHWIGRFLLRLANDVHLWALRASAPPALCRHRCRFSKTTHTLLPYSVRRLVALSVGIIQCLIPLLQACNLANPCLQLPAMCSTGIAGGSGHFTWFCPSDLWPNALPNGGGQICFATESACTDGPNLCATPLHPASCRQRPGLCSTGPAIAYLQQNGTAWVCEPSGQAQSLPNGDGAAFPGAPRRHAPSRTVASGPGAAACGPACLPAESAGIGR